jgi:hypothetical protein
VRSVFISGKVFNFQSLAILAFLAILALICGKLLLLNPRLSACIRGKNLVSPCLRAAVVGVLLFNFQSLAILAFLAILALICGKLFLLNPRLSACIRGKNLILSVPLCLRGRCLDSQIRNSNYPLIQS